MTVSPVISDAVGSFTGLVAVRIFCVTNDLFGALVRQHFGF